MGVASEEGRSVVLATLRGTVLVTVPGDGRGLDRQFCLSTEEAWCLAQQLLLAVRRADRC